MELLLCLGFPEHGMRSWEAFSEYKPSWQLLKSFGRDSKHTAQVFWRFSELLAQTSGL